MVASDRCDGVAVDLGGDGDAAVPEGAGDVFDGDPGGGERARSGVPGVDAERILTPLCWPDPEN